MLYKQIQKADAHLPTGIKDENKHIIFFHHEKTLMFGFLRLMLHLPYTTLQLNLTYKYGIRILLTDGRE